MKEYGIYIRQGSGTPYMIHFYNNIESAKLKLYDMISLEEERQRPYFVDNDFFNNKNNTSAKLTYYCIKEREVTEWEKYSKDKSDIKNNNKIIYLKDFEKVLTN